jgi:hypothetical protein
MEMNGFPSGSFAIVSAVNGKALTATAVVAKQSGGRAQKLELATLDGSLSQLWTYTGAIVVNEHTGKALDNAGGVVKKGKGEDWASQNNTILWPPHSGCNQRLHYDPACKTMIFVGKYRWTLDIDGHGGDPGNQWELCGAEAIEGKLKAEELKAKRRATVEKHTKAAAQEPLLKTELELQTAEQKAEPPLEQHALQLLAFAKAELEQAGPWWGPLNTRCEELGLDGRGPRSRLARRIVEHAHPALASGGCDAVFQTWHDAADKADDAFKATRAAEQERELAEIVGRERAENQGAKDVVRAQFEAARCVPSPPFTPPPFTPPPFA